MMGSTGISGGLFLCAVLLARKVGAAMVKNSRSKSKSRDKSRDKQSKDKRAGDKTKKLKGASAVALHDKTETSDGLPDLPDPIVTARKRPRSATPSRRGTTARTSGIRRARRRSRAPADGAEVTPLADRVVNAIENELDMIEKIVGRPNAGPGQRTDAERRARTLASLARTLSELKKIQSVDLPTKAADDAVAAGDDEAFRLDLARRLGVVVAEAKTVHPDEEPPV
jgi:hypothetical protein